MIQCYIDFTWASSPRQTEGHTMKRLLILGTLFLAACGGTRTVYVESTDAPETTVKVIKTTDAPPVVTSPPWSAEDEFILDIELNYPGIIYVSEYEMIDTGYTVCESLRLGVSGEEVIWAILGAGGDTEFITTVVASAVANFCPEQSWKFQTL